MSIVSKRYAYPYVRNYTKILNLYNMKFIYVYNAEFFLCLINYAPRNEDVRGSGGIEPCILASAQDGGE
jgi:hypothetical protein